VATLVSKIIFVARVIFDVETLALDSMHNRAWLWMVDWKFVDVDVVDFRHDYTTCQIEVGKLRNISWPRFKKLGGQLSGFQNPQCTDNFLCILQVRQKEVPYLGS